LQALGGGEQLGIDRCCADRSANLAHRLADCIEESPARILHQMPTIGDLGGMGRPLHRIRPAVTSDGGNLLMLLKPSCR
jgi:hypothetical protein